MVVAWKITEPESNIRSVAQRVLDSMNRSELLLLEGNLGAGKTTFVKELCALLQIPEQQLSSPTFAIVNEYQTLQNKKVYHFDLYRIKNFEELLDIGIDEYLAEDSLSLVEWPEILVPYLEDNYALLQIEHTEDTNLRKYTFSYGNDLL